MSYSLESPGILDQFKGFLDTPDIRRKEINEDFKIFQFPSVEINDKLISDLEQIEHPRNSVLGKRMESFFSVAINHSERYDLISSNIQIIENKQTLGEIDFLLFDKQKEKPLHVELVYKLYIYDPEISSKAERWIGPNRKDSFSQKLNKLKSRQFPLLHRPETFKYLKNFDLVPEEVVQELCFKAKLFLPDKKDTVEPGFINPECLTGNWFTMEEFRKKPWQENLFFWPAKRNWSTHPGFDENWFGYEEAIQNIRNLFQRKKAPLIWMKTKEGYHSFFVVWW